MSFWGWVAFVVYCAICLIVGGITYEVICVIEHQFDDRDPWSV